MFCDLIFTTNGGYFIFLSFLSLQITCESVLLRQSVEEIWTGYASRGILLCRGLQAEPHRACLGSSDKETDLGISDRHLAWRHPSPTAAASTAWTAGREGADCLQAGTGAAGRVLGWHSILWLHCHLAPCHVRLTGSPASHHSSQPDFETGASRKWTCAGRGPAPTQAPQEVGRHAGFQQMYCTRMFPLLSTPTKQPNCMPALQLLPHPGSSRWILPNVSTDEVLQPSAPWWTHAHQTGPGSWTMPSLLNIPLHQQDWPDTAPTVNSLEITVNNKQSTSSDKDLKSTAISNTLSMFTHGNLLRTLYWSVQLFNINKNIQSRWITYHIILCFNVG